MADDQIQMPPLWKQFPGLYAQQQAAQPKLNMDKQVNQERIAGEFLSPQEQVLRRAMQVGNFQPADLNKLDIPQGPDLGGLINSLRSRHQPVVTQPNNPIPGVISTPAPDTMKVDAQASPAPIANSDDADLDSDLRALKSLRGK